MPMGEQYGRRDGTNLRARCDCTLCERVATLTVLHDMSTSLTVVCARRCARSGSALDWFVARASQEPL